MAEVTGTVGTSKQHISYWNAFLFCHIYTQGEKGYVLGPVFDKRQFMLILVPFEYFSEKLPSCKVKVFSIKE